MKKEKKMKFILIVMLLASGFLIDLNAQSPIEDDNWELNVNKSDEFNDEILNLSKWDKWYPPDGVGWYVPPNWWSKDHVYIEDNLLKIKVEPKPNSNYYYAGGVQTDEHHYSYGYYEINAKLPGFYNDGEPCGLGFWPKFWTWWAEKDKLGCRIIHDEIDILEPGPTTQYADAKSNVAGWWDEQTDPPCTQTKRSGDIWYTHSEPLFEDFHKYGLEWLPDRINFYFDDEPFYVSYNHPKMVMKPQYVVIQQEISDDLLPNTPFPQYYTVDYFRYYELNTTGCDQDVTILSNFQLNNFGYGIKRTIQIGNGSTSISIPGGDSKTFRATDEISIAGDFTVPLGSGLNLIPTPCN